MMDLCLEFLLLENLKKSMDSMKNIKHFKTIPFTKFNLWDVKRYIFSDIKSNYPILPLSSLIVERSERKKLFNYPNENFKILGVNNKIGLFDAYSEKGSNINQPYKYVNEKDLCYNPYRINVGSIGIKTSIQKNDYISPAYVVFYCTDELSPEFLYLVFKTEIFKKLIVDNTTGSVRQNLKFDTLSKIEIPVPPIKIQKKLIDSYEKLIAIAKKQEKEAKLIEHSIEKYIFDSLNINQKISEKKPESLQHIEYKNIERWDIKSLNFIHNVETRFKGMYPLIKLGNIIESYQYGLSEKSNKSSIGYPMLRMNNINNSLLSISNIKYIQITEEILSHFKLNKGDLLFNRTNSKELVGKTAIFDINGDYTFASYLIRVVIDKKIANNKFINYLFNSSILNFQKNLISRQVTGQANINAQEMKDLLFPLPPIKIQNKIASNIEIMKKKSENLKQQSKINIQQAINILEQKIYEIK